MRSFAGSPLTLIFAIFVLFIVGSCCATQFKRSVDVWQLQSQRATAASWWNAETEMNALADAYMEAETALDHAQSTLDALPRPGNVWNEQERANATAKARARATVVRARETHVAVATLAAPGPARLTPPPPAVYVDIDAEDKTWDRAQADLKKARATLSAGAAAKLNKEPGIGRTWQDRAWARATATKARSVLDRITTARERRPTATATPQPDAQTAYNDDDRGVWRILRHLFRGRRR